MPRLQEIFENLKMDKTSSGWSLEQNNSSGGKSFNIKLSEAQRNMKENILILKLGKQDTEIQYEIVRAPGHFSADQFPTRSTFPGLCFPLSCRR